MKPSQLQNHKQNHSVLVSLENLKNSADFIELKNSDKLKIDLRYATTNNFVGQNMYGPFQTAFLHKVAAEKFWVAQDNLTKQNPSFGFLIFDALRPRSIQRILWDHVKGSEGEKYIANPDLGSLHNFGFAIDLTIMDQAGHELDMGADFDDFRPIAQPQLETQFYAAGQLSKEHLQNRQLLRSVMEGAGFKQLPHEWWHFDALEKQKVRQSYLIVE